MMAHLALYAPLDHRCDSTSALQTIVREPWPITLMPLMWSYFLQITYTTLKILPRSMPSSEHLFPMPFHKPFTRIIFFHLRQRDLFPRKIPEQPLYHPATIHRVGNHHTHIFIRANRTTIERFMMNCAQRRH